MSRPTATSSYWAGDPANSNIFRWRNGVAEQLTSDASSTVRNVNPLTDGNLVVYRKTAGCCIDDPGRVAIHENGQEVVLDSLRTPGPTPYMDYRVVNGWVAYTRAGSAGELQVWVRNPAGQTSQVSPGGLDAQIVGLGPQGDVLFKHRSGTPRDVYLGEPGAPLVNLGASLGGAFPFSQASFKRIDSEWYEGSGRLLSKLRRSSYVRPLAASPLKVSLVPAYDRCESPNGQHGPPLAFPSCAPPSQTSDHLTMGTADANPNVANFVGSVRMQVLLGDPGTPADEADVKLDLRATDVRTAGALDDYAGELRPTVRMRTTDRDTTATLHSGSFRDMEDTTPVRIRTTFPSQHGLTTGAQILLDDFPGGPTGVPCISGQPWTVTVIDEDTLTLDGSTACGAVFNSSGRWHERGEPGTGPGTGVEVPLSFTAACAPTPDPAIGATCSASTTAEALVPGMVKERMRSIWQLDEVQVFDGGADGDAETEADNTLFATQGVFIP